MLGKALSGPRRRYDSMNYTLLVTLQLIYIVPSLLLYLAQFCFIALTKDPEFSTAFHYIFLARAPADMVQVAASLLTFRFPVAGWGAVLDKPYIAKMGFVFSQYACLLELFAQLSLSVNRFTAICFPLRHNRWWTLTRTLKLFAICSLLALIPTAMRLPQEAGYIAVQGKIVPYLIHEEDQKTNSYVSSCIYVFFGLFCFVLNVFSLIKHSQQRNLKLFDQQQALTRRLQLNLLVYSSSFTLAIISMTVCQCLLALDIFPLKTDGHALLIIVLTLSADYFALSNPWFVSKATYWELFVYILEDCKGGRLSSNREEKAMMLREQSHRTITNSSLLKPAFGRIPQWTTSTIGSLITSTTESFEITKRRLSPEIVKLLYASGEQQEMQGTKNSRSSSEGCAERRKRRPQEKRAEMLTKAAMPVETSPTVRKNDRFLEPRRNS
ncbi:hypothetical protein RB195_017544 [Necator americanus]|uniref:Serpentine receptor class gamma n=1 Tax=Necator americanus TaxID=51031 RepID=A0ABR1C8V4_NECAM